MNVLEILRRPIITEKSTAMQAMSKYAFEVYSWANKIQIKQAVEKAFNVKVAAVNVMIMPGKEKRMGRRMTQTPEWKKAIITLKPGHKITLVEGV
ncbi:MAG: 50S ribosomal protein L23 [Dehalococcoidia bacterium]|nr:large subunit ribosomal protein L23 [Dehalococcoidia bacterium]MBF8303633.1 large subunit ribosomal protein [Dehalococcoidia bacterium]MDO8637874.1 50S ribosomal protein L23 [Dehalococcoidia bacterium]